MQKSANMPNAPTIVQTIAGALAAAGVVASAAKYTGVWTTFMTRVRRAIETGDSRDIEAAVHVVNAAGPQAVVALDNLQRRLSGSQASRVASIRRRASV